MGLDKTPGESPDHASGKKRPLAEIDVERKQVNDERRANEDVEAKQTYKVCDIAEQALCCEDSEIAELVLDLAEADQTELAKVVLECDVRHILDVPLRELDDVIKERVTGFLKAEGGKWAEAINGNLSIREISVLAKEHVSFNLRALDRVKNG
jgi:hypothetical protein